MADALTHEEALVLLPWFVNGTLAAGEQTAVERHAKSCVICRRELAELVSIAKHVADAADERPLPAADMRGINARIDADIERRDTGIARMVRACGNPWRFAFLVQTAVVVAAGFMLWRTVPDAEFTTLTAPDGLPAGDYLRVVFAPGLELERIEYLLASHGLTTVGGPTERGVYTLKFDEHRDPDGLSRTLAAFENDAGVLFVQPVAGESPQ